MNRLSIGVLLTGLVAASTAHAQAGAPGPCPPYPPPASAVTFNPSLPGTADPVLVSIVPKQVVPGDVLTNSVSALVVGTTINLTLTGTYNGFGLPPACGSVTIGPLASGTYTVNYFQGVNGSPPSLQSTSTLLVTDASPSSNYQGLWWTPDGAEAGWGINLAHEADTIVATWFTYDAYGKGIWLVMTAPKVGPNTYAGKLYLTRGPAFNANPFDPNRVALYTPAWDGVLHFDDANHGAFTYTVPDGFGAPPLVRTKTITRQEFGPAPTCVFGELPDLSLATNYTDLWWGTPAGAEAGWGVNLTHQGDTIFVTWFTYDLDGSSMWLVATTEKSGPSMYTGTLYRTTGPAYFLNPFDPTKVVATEMGSIALDFASGNQATMTYSVNTASGIVKQNKNITREVFIAPGTSCR